MKVVVARLCALLLAATAVLASCDGTNPAGPRQATVTDAPSATVSTPVGALQPAFKKGPPTNAGGSGDDGLLVCKAQSPETASMTVGPGGGKMKIGKNKFEVPAGALTREVTITAVVDSMNVNHIQFKPEGLRFRIPATLEMKYANCKDGGLLVQKRIAYVDPQLHVISYVPSVDDKGSKKVVGLLSHFSDYAVAW